MTRQRSALRRLGDLLAPDGPPDDVAAHLADDVLARAEHHRLLPAVWSALAGAGVEAADDRLRTRARIRRLVLATA